MPVFRKYMDQNEAMSHLVTLREHGLDADLSQIFDSGIQVFSIEMEEADFNAANQLLDAEPGEESTSMDFSNYSLDELKDIIIKANEYSAEFIKLVSVELEERGISDLTPLLEDQQSHKSGVVDEIKQGTSIMPAWLVLYYIFAFAGGVLGFGIGWFVETGKTKAPDGNDYFTYDDFSRKHGKRIKWLGIIFTIFWVIERFFYPQF